MTEKLAVPAWVVMERVDDAVQLLHPHFNTLADAAREGWSIRDVFPLGAIIPPGAKCPVLVLLERDDTSKMDAKRQ